MNWHPYELLDNRDSRKLIDQVLINKKPISSLNKYYNKKKFLLHCLADSELSRDFGFFDLSKKSLKKLINIWAITGDGLSSSLPKEIVKHLSFENFFVYCRSLENPISAIREYKKHNKTKTSFKKLFEISKKNELFTNNTEWILNSADHLITFAEEFNIKIEPIVKHPYNDWHIGEYDLDCFADNTKYNDKEKKRILNNFRRLFKTWYAKEGYRMYVL
jgi:hypothetical protein